jgi:hypothetical protein
MAQMPDGRSSAVLLRAAGTLPVVQPEERGRGRTRGVAAAIARALREPWVLVLLGCLAIIIAVYVVYASNGITLAYADGRAKLNMARRVWDDLNPGFGQIGGVWLPLPTLLFAITAWSDPLYYSGLSGSIWSMLAFAGTGALLFLLARRMTGHWAGGLAAALLLVANPSAVYLATTPMAEPLLICGVAASAFFLARAEEQPRDQNRVFWLGVAAFLFSLARYEGWFFLGLTTLALVVIFWKARLPVAEIQARLIAFLTVAGLGVVFWLLWETIIFHDPLFFAHSRYSAHAIDVVAYGIDQNVHHLGTAIATYWQALQANVPGWELALAGAGLALYLVREFRTPRNARIAPLILLGVPLYFIIVLYTGEGAIDMRSTPYYNVRYGTIAVPLVAAFAGYALVAVLPRLLKPAGVAAALAIAGLALPALIAHSTAVLNDRGAQSDPLRLQIIAYLKRSYDGGRILIETFKNNDISFSARIPQRALIAEGNPQLFHAALIQPQLFAEWIYAGKNELSATGDTVATAFAANPALLDGYDVVLDNGAATLYRLKPELRGALVPDRDLERVAEEVLKQARTRQRNLTALDDCGPQTPYQVVWQRRAACNR